MTNFQFSIGLPRFQPFCLLLVSSSPGFLMFPPWPRLHRAAPPCRFVQFVSHSAIFVAGGDRLPLTITGI